MGVVQATGIGKGGQLKAIQIGTRGSQLALWQAKYVRDLLVKAFPDLEIELKVIKTRGDKNQDQPLPDIGGKGLFTKEIEDALLSDRIDLAVHSLKDLPSTLPAGLRIAGSPLRADCRDTFLSTRWTSLKDVPVGGRIATGSMRRRSQIRNRYPELVMGNLRGNIATRIQKLESEGWDGIIIAAAALERLDLSHRVSEYLDPEYFVPAVGQGAIGIEVKADRKDIHSMVQKISDPETVAGVSAEREFMRQLEGGCSVPIGAWGRIQNGTWFLTGYFASIEGDRTIRETISGPGLEPERFGRQLADRFLAAGVKELFTR